MEQQHRALRPGQGVERRNVCEPGTNHPLDIPVHHPAQGPVRHMARRQPAAHHLLRVGKSRHDDGAVEVGALRRRQQHRSTAHRMPQGCHARRVNARLQRQPVQCAAQVLGKTGQRAVAITVAAAMVARLGQQHGIACLVQCLRSRQQRAGVAAPAMQQHHGGGRLRARLGHVPGKQRQSPHCGNTHRLGRQPQCQGLHACLGRLGRQTPMQCVAQAPQHQRHSAQPECRMAHHSQSPVLKGPRYRCARPAAEPGATRHHAPSTLHRSKTLLN